jgi:hypothetical protein
MAISRKDRGSPVVKKNDAYTGMLFISLLAMTTACVLLYLDYSKYGDAKPPKEPPPLPGAKAPAERPSAVDKKPKEQPTEPEPKEPKVPTNPMPTDPMPPVKPGPMPMGNGMLAPAREPAAAVAARAPELLPIAREPVVNSAALSRVAVRDSASESAPAPAPAAHARSPVGRIASAAPTAAATVPDPPAPGVEIIRAEPPSVLANGLPTIHKPR